MIQVSNPSKFPEDCCITFFSGKDVEDAVRMAREWAKERNIKVYSYYPQVVPGRSILVSYKINENIPR